MARGKTSSPEKNFICGIRRIKNDIESIGDKFLKRIYTDREIDYCNSKGKQKYQSYAARFAAKEAIYKAISDYINFNYSWQDFEILNDKNGQPYVNLGFKIENLEDINISLSHCKEYAVANAVAIYKES